MKKIASLVLAIQLLTRSAMACNAHNPCGLYNTQADWTCPTGYSCGGVHCIYQWGFLVNVEGWCIKGSDELSVDTDLSPYFP